VHIRCGSGGEVRVLWDQLQPHNVPDWAAGAVDGHGGRERERVVWIGAAAAFVGCICRRFLSGTLPHHYYCLSHLHPGLSLSLSISAPLNQINCKTIKRLESF